VSDIVVRRMREDDLAAADRINRTAFGTFFNLEDPMSFRGDGDVVPGRFRANPDGAFVAESGSGLVACGFVMDWGSAGILGPLTVDVAHWSGGIGGAVMTEMIAYLDERGFALQGLFTHPQSTRHVRLYEGFGFWMQRMTAVMEKAVAADAAMPDAARPFSALDAAGKTVALDACRAVANSVHPGLDLTREIRSIDADGFGETLLVERGGGIVAFACCHQGAGSEAGSAQAVVKFAAVKSGAGAAADFSTLLQASEAFASGRGVGRLVAGTNTGRCECYRAMLQAGFRSWMNGIAMFRPEGDGYNRPGVYVIDDWR